jgi:tetratricopeptide (TPR) repeat protein
MPAAKLEDHLAFLLDQLTKLGAKRPDLASLRSLHEDATWRLIEIHEKAEDWKASETLMQSAADLRRQWMQVATAQRNDPAAYQYGIYLRRLSWLKNAHLKDPAGAEGLGRRAVDHWTPLADEDPKQVVIGYQSVLALEVHGEALLALGRREEAIAQIKAAKVKATELMTGLEQEGDSDVKQNVENELRYLSDRLAQLRG